jgi:hypothetical protein
LADSHRQFSQQADNLCLCLFSVCLRWSSHPVRLSPGAEAGGAEAGTACQQSYGLFQSLPQSQDSRPLTLIPSCLSLSSLSQGTAVTCSHSQTQIQNQTHSRSRLLSVSFSSTARPEASARSQEAPHRQGIRHSAATGEAPSREELVSVVGVVADGALYNMACAILYIVSCCAISLPLLLPCLPSFPSLHDVRCRYCIHPLPVIPLLPISTSCN